MGNRKILLIIFLIIIFLCICTSCSSGDSAYYESFYEDMDIPVRAEEYLHKAESGDTSAFYYDELITFKEDLSLIPEECDDNAIEVNRSFIAAADMLLSTFRNSRNGNTADAAECLETAWECYNNGIMRYNDYVLGN